MTATLPSRDELESILTGAKDDILTTTLREIGQVTNQMIQRLKSVEDNVAALRDERALSRDNTIGEDDDLAVLLAANIPFIDFDSFLRQVINRGFPKASAVPPDMPS